MNNAIELWDGEFEKYEKKGANAGTWKEIRDSGMFIPSVIAHLSILQKVPAVLWY